MIHVENGDLGGIVVKVRGDLDFACRDAFRKTLDLAVDGGTKALIVSLEECGYCDCAAIGVLIAVRKTIGSRLKLIIPSASPVHRIFELAGLLKHFEVAPTVAAALASVPYPSTSRDMEFAYPRVA